MTSGARIYQWSSGNRIGCASAVSAVVGVGGMVVDRLAPRRVSGKYSHGAALRAVHLCVTLWPLASSSIAGCIDRLGLLVHAKGIIG